MHTVHASALYGHYIIKYLLTHQNVDGTQQSVTFLREALHFVPLAVEAAATLTQNCLPWVVSQHNNSTKLTQQFQIYVKDGEMYNIC